MSRRKREGRYFGWSKGHHFRTRYYFVVSSWLCFRQWVDSRHYTKWKGRKS